MPRVCPDHLLIRLSSGNLRLEFPRLEQILREGAVAFIPAGTAFALHPYGAVAGDVLIIPACLTHQTGTVLPSVVLTGCPRTPDAAAIQIQMRRLGQMPCALGRARPMPVMTQDLNRLALILPRLKNVATPPCTPGHPSAFRPLVERFLRMVRRDIARGTTIAELAQELRVSTPDLDRACHFQRGRSPLELIYDLRLERAVDLLRAGHAPAAIALQTGYAGLPHMKRAFIAATGRKPEDFAPEGPQS